MKRIITLILFLFIATGVFAQTDGITYQAVIIGPDALELPGVDSQDNYLPTTDIAIKFSIIAPGSGVVEFTEIQNTTTDEFGRINLIIGAENHDDFEKIDWNGDPKSLKVEVDFNNGDGFVDMSVEKLTYVPYVAHRDITATGTLEVDDDTFLNRELTVNGPTTINSTLNIEDGNPANFSGDLNVDGETNLNNTFNVTGQSASNLSGALIVGDTLTGPPNFDTNAPTVLAGSLDVKGQSTFGALESKTLTVEESTTLRGALNVDVTEQIVLRSELNNSIPVYESAVGGLYTDGTTRSISTTDSAKNPGLELANYPVLVEGSNQGIAIKINAPRGNGNNFVSFWDESANGATPLMWGRIEGERQSEFENNADYLFDKSSLDYDIYEAWIDMGFAISDASLATLQLAKTYIDYRPCIGIAPCVGGPGPADITYAAAEVVADWIQVGFATDAKNRAVDYEVQYDANKLEFEGVSYASGAGDYAEYLERIDLSERMTYGDIVGVKGGKISKNLNGAERMMVVSYKPIVLGNMPTPSEESKFEKVAFMGQVPVKVFGVVNIGDYIIPSGNNDGIGVAVSPEKITLNQIKNIVGRAWAKSDGIKTFTLVNVAVGLNNNDNNPIVEKLEKTVAQQAEEILELKNQIAEIKNMLLNGTSESNAKVLSQEPETFETSGTFNGRKYEVVDTENGEIIYWEITEADFENGLKLAEEQMRAEGVDVDNHKILDKLKNDSTYKKEIFAKVKSDLDKYLHFHKDDLNGDRH